MGEPVRLLTAGLTANEAALYALLWEEAGFRPGTIKVNAFLLAAKLGADPRSVRKWMNTLAERGLIEVADRPEARRDHWLVYVCEAARIESPKPAKRPDPQKPLLDLADPEQNAQTVPGPEPTVLWLPIFCRRNRGLG